MNSRLFLRAFGLLAGVARRVIREAGLRRAEVQLHELDDRMLRDLGLTRDQVGSAVRMSGPAQPAMPVRPAGPPAPALEQDRHPARKAA